MEKRTGAVKAYRRVALCSGFIRGAQVALAEAERQYKKAMRGQQPDDVLYWRRMVRMHEDDIARLSIRMETSGDPLTVIR